MKKSVRKLFILCLWLAVWQLAAMLIHQPIFLPSPWEVVAALVHKCTHADFWLSLLGSTLHLAAGFAAGCLSALFLVYLTWRRPFMEEILDPPLTFMKAVPIAAFTMLILIWSGSRHLAVPIVIILVLPVLYQNLLSGLRQITGKQKEMAEIFRLKRRAYYLYILRPAVKETAEGSSRLAVSMAWKAGVAAEVIGVSANSIGEQLYTAKINLETADVFAWALVIILMSGICERLMTLICKRLFAPPVFRLVSPDTQAVPDFYAGVSVSPEIQVRNLSFSYKDKNVLNHISLDCKPADTVYIEGPSGRGKTTLLRILAGLEQADGVLLFEGEKRADRIVFSAVFQENRLCMDMSALANTAVDYYKLPRSTRREYLQYCRAILLDLLPEEALLKPVSQLSGGMQRRTAAARALASDSMYLILDEPFAGLDPKTAACTAAAIRKYRRNRTIFIATHQKEGTEDLPGRHVQL